MYAGFANLSKAIHNIWTAYSTEVGSSYLSCAQLRVFCERLGLPPKISERVACDCFKRRRIYADCCTPEQLMTLHEFIDLLAASTDREVDFQKCCASTRSPTHACVLYEGVAAYGRRCADTASGVDLLKGAQEMPMETLSLQNIVEIWETANISNGRGILLALGFNDNEVNVAELSKVLEEELRNLEDEPQMTLLRALVALQSAELTTLRQTFRQLRDENTKLRADNKDANRRVSLLAVEIDERHASLEDSYKKEIRTLEEKHATVVREFTAQLSNDREHWTNLNSRLESRIKSFEQDELRWKTELEVVRKDNDYLENEQQKLQKQITELLEQNIQLNRDVADFADSRQSEEHVSSDDKETEDEVLRLVEKISALQVENTNLRDKNDELVAEVESLNLELIRVKAKSKKSKDSDEVAVEEAETGTSCTATKRRGDSPSKANISEESPRLGKLRKCTNGEGGTENSDTSGEWLALNSELQQTVAASVDDAIEEITALKSKISKLEEQLKLTQSTGDKSPTEERCKELEASLEQMQREYEECEDYWQSKLSEERMLFEKERQIYEDEQQESDRKFTELMEKVREYEEQFSKDGRLSPIEEKDLLEQQYIELEAEAERVRENARIMFEEKTKEIETLQHEVEDLRVRLGESVEILTGACELNRQAVAENAKTVNMHSPASSPISYLWHQSTIQEPAKSYQMQLTSSGGKQPCRNHLSTSETAIFSTTLMDKTDSTQSSSQPLSPIRKPNSGKTLQSSEGDAADCDTSSTGSGKSFETHSVTSTPSGQRAQGQGALVLSRENSCSSPSSIKEELKRLKFFELSLKEQIKDLSLERDGLVMELQQLQEARPVLEKAYARTAHPSLIQRVNQLELKNRHLQNVIKQQQQYTESLMQQSWRQHQAELNDLHSRIETQGGMIAEQVQRLQNADILVKDLYVENSHLTATIQRLEQQRVLVNLMHAPQRQDLNGLPGMP